MKTFPRLLAQTCALLFSVLLPFASSSAAEAYPDKPIRMIVPFPPGGASDNLARGLASEMGKRLGQSIVIVNKPGGGTVIASGFVANSPPDGYTLLWIAPPYAINATLMKSLPYDTKTSLVSVCDIASSPMLVTVNKSANIKTLAELVARAKQKTLTYGSSGVGGTPHLATVMFENAVGAKMTHIPFQGSAPAVTALLGGQVDVVVDTPLSTLPQINAGNLVALAQTGATRLPLVPNIPTLQELGIKGYEANTWFAVMAPAATPKPIVAQLNKVMNEIVHDPRFRETFANQGLVMMGGSPQEAADRLNREISRWGEAVRISGASVS
ncbi:MULTISPECIES: tripartite tricarboxylate transporter substrate binding protein [unclassified Achromobacter]|uniref:Bug family tripartite tricarboxylate transporter substrate binding protein n=1 Tax=unclassified Achromobacter TaxID=2626865 RepID=UPI001303602C|nr:MULTISPECIES: tripartite tricarboxylate transporter substrate binding protein [unclassified Achromobacter]